MRACISWHYKESNLHVTMLEIYASKHLGWKRVELAFKRFARRKGHRGEA